MAWQAEMSRSGSRIVTTEAVLWEWLNALADTVFSHAIVMSDANLGTDHLDDVGELSTALATNQ